MVMKQAAELEWTDGVGKALSSLGSAISKAERAKRDDGEDYFADPHLLVQDLTTGTTVLLRTEEHEGGKTQGRGYRRCSSVTQRIHVSIPTKKVMSRLLAMAIRNFVPKDSDAATVGPVVQKAVDDIAAIILDESEWDTTTADHAPALNAALNQILGTTERKRAGDTLLKVEAIPMSTAVMDIDALQLEIENEVNE
jgi:hypothetical protein